MSSILIISKKVSQCEVSNPPSNGFTRKTIYFVMSLVMIIRKFKEEDAVRVSEIIWKALEVSNSKDYGQDVLLNMKKEYSAERIGFLSKSRTLLIAEDAGMVIGVGGIENDFISCVFVDPDQQGKGIGRGIMKALEAIAKDNRYQAVFLHSSITAESFYAGIGYLVEKRNADPYYGENVLMRKMV